MTGERGEHDSFMRTMAAAHSSICSSSERELRLFLDLKGVKDHLLTKTDNTIKKTTKFILKIEVNRRMNNFQIIQERRRTFRSEKGEPRDPPGATVRSPAPIPARPYGPSFAPTHTATHSRPAPHMPRSAWTLNPHIPPSARAFACVHKSDLCARLFTEHAVGGAKNAAL